MDKEKEFFLKTLKDFIRGKQTTVPEDLDMERTEAYAKSHEVEAIFYLQTKLSEFRNAYYMQLMLNSIQIEVLEIIEENFKDIPYLIVKGPVVAQYYPVKEIRSMGDIDVVVHLEDRERAHKKFLDLGFELHDQTEGEWEYYYNGLMIELHTALIYTYSTAVSSRKHFEFFNNCWNYYKDGKLDPNFHILFLFFHLRKHIMESGVGFRQFLDIAVIEKKANADWKWIADKAEELDIFPFIKRVLAFNEKWFGVKSPYKGEHLSQDVFEITTEHIFNDGVFGFDNYENLRNRVINEKKTGTKLYGIRALIEHVFWPYEKLIRMDQYAWLSGKKYLTPIAWGYRAANKWKDWGKLKKRYYASDKDVSDRYYYLLNWNIENDTE